MPLRRRHTDDLVEAHDQKLTIELVTHVPAHLPRETDPHYKAFREARRRMKAQGLLACAIKGCRYGTAAGPIELHHSKIEFSLQGGVDLSSFNELYGLHLDETSFRDFVESPGNLEPLCIPHHRTLVGVHSLPGPFWDALRIWRPDLLPPAELLTGEVRSRS